MDGGCDRRVRKRQAVDGDAERPGSFARRSQEAGNIGIRNCKAGRIDRSGERPS
jgi:hypothetical protein